MRTALLTLIVAAVLLAATDAFAQIRVGARTGSSSIGRGVLKQDDPAAERKRMETACIYHLDKARDFLDKKCYGPAMEKLRRAKGLLVSRELAVRWGEIGETLNKAGNEQIAKADELFEKQDYAKAKDIYKRISMTFAGLPVSRTARQRLADVKADPDVESVGAEKKAVALYKSAFGIIERHRKREADEAKAAAAAAAKAATTTQPVIAAPPPILSDIEVINALGDDDLLRVADLLERIVTEHGATATGQEAAGLQQTLGESSLYKQRLDRLRAQQLAGKEFAKANAYFSAGLLDKAAVMYKEITKKYPDTPQATEALKLLTKIEMVRQP